mmetsp:Transcript_97720/g.146503  ORF Transcript_97720/g.146503 Transcript_97720/m.146503 type:complete len:317 (+) Transcript_97720:1191-2141(+)
MEEGSLLEVSPLLSPDAAGMAVLLASNTCFRFSARISFFDVVSMFDFKGSRELCTDSKLLPFRTWRARCLASAALRRFSTSDIEVNPCSEVSTFAFTVASVPTCAGFCVSRSLSLPSRMTPRRSSTRRFPFFLHHNSRSPVTDFTLSLATSSFSSTIAVDSFAHSAALKLLVAFGVWALVCSLASSRTRRSNERRASFTDFTLSTIATVDRAETLSSSSALGVAGAASSSGCLTASTRRTVSTTSGSGRMVFDGAMYPSFSPTRRLPFFLHHDILSKLPRVPVGVTTAVRSIDVESLLFSVFSLFSAFLAHLAARA